MTKKGTKKKETVKEEEASGSGSSKWSKADDAVPIETLTGQKEVGYWGDNNPKLTVWVGMPRSSLVWFGGHFLRTLNWTLGLVWGSG
jgi:hypothetical protein